MKNIITYVVCFVVGFSMSAQVGIGTTTPDASSILDITSTTQGMLAPRMTTAQRNGIASPANGLLVYDTDDSAFYYYNSVSWIRLGNKARNNFKLIQSAADLADELVAGGNTSYLLDSDTYYEINGLISLAHPINLNDAYLSGLDANEDILVRANGTLFEGTTGGAVRNVSIGIVNGSVFNLTGDGDDVLLFQNCIVGGNVGTESLGTISDFNIVFKNIINIDGMDDGITYNNINNLLLSNVAFFENNAGTFETYTGNFDLIEKVSGFMKVSAGATGVDVSSNPTVTKGSILSMPFLGAGTYVNGYTTGTYAGYFFDSSWDVDAPGIEQESNSNAAADFYYDGSLTTGFTQTINDAAVEIQGGGTFSSTNLYRFSATGGGNRLVYEGDDIRKFRVAASLSVLIADARGDYFAILVYKNGVPVTQSNVLLYVDAAFGNDQIQNVALNTIIEMQPNDYIEIFIDRLTGTGNDGLVVFSQTVTVN